ncbi:hypothetical protein N7495_004387 [Penicillium taxi]|uniref:uncharacterized protein n=1 Tax=Penicillium taxi TaxID=168475 RepID=UPI0025450276|nr:uncharacterized protein N7495_004387 [Penicillium taxi]KAJ5899643.1 hypothetical protein N7495_004387 [Penicillium taxi]
MSSNLTILDIPTLVEVTRELYSRCQPITKDAPDGFQSLVEELGLMQHIAQTLENDFSSKTPFLEKMGEGRKVVLERCLNACFQALEQFKVLLQRYQEAGIGEGKQFWQKIKWSTQQTHVEDLRSKILVHSCNLSFFTGSIRNVLLQRSMKESNQMDKSLHDSFSFSSADLDIANLPQSEKDESSSEHEQPVQVPRRLRPRISPRILRDGPNLVRISTSSNSIASLRSRGTSYARITPTLPLSFNSNYSLSETVNGRIGGAQHRSDQIIYEDSVYSHEIEEIYWEADSDKKGLHEKSEVSSLDLGYDDVMEAVDRVMHGLNQIRLEEKLTQPIRYVPQSKLHRPDFETIKAFEASIIGGPQVRTIIMRDWLVVAIWWLLKAKNTLANCSRHNYVNARGSMSPTTDLRSDSQQAYVNLLKASYILYNIVLQDESSPALLSDENRKSIAEISEGINEELSQFTSIDIPDPSMLLSQNLEIWEPLQYEETPNITDLSFGTENTRWIAVNQDDAGNEEEKFLYRTFVNAGIGSKKFRMRTKRAPYMLLLTAKEVESEPKIVLCNQSGSLCLQRDFVPEDLPQMVEISNAALARFPGTQISEPLYFKFNNTSVTIYFQFEAHLTNFIAMPNSYFNAVKLRQPLHSKEFTESVIFKNYVETLEQPKMPNLIPINLPAVSKSCEVRILERSFSEAWRCMRRMVISLSVAEKASRCIELFLPLSRVRVYHEDESNQVLLKWSDTCQERFDKTDGNYNMLHSYVYDDSMPNLGISLRFRTPQAAVELKNAILEMNFKTCFAWSQPSSSGCIYDVVDTNMEQKQCKALVLFQNNDSWQYSDVYYLYRDADFVYNQPLKIQFPRASYTDYISNHVDQLYAADSPIGFSHCQLEIGPATVEFDDEAISRAFLSALSPLYELLYSRRIHSLSTKTRPIFGQKKSEKGAARLQLWRRAGDSFQLAARWQDDVRNKWLTMAVPSDLADKSRDGTRVNFPRLPYSRGVTLDMMNIMTRGPKSTIVESHEGSLAFIFETSVGKIIFLPDC